MRKFAITNPAFTGEIYILYNENGLLVNLDATETNCIDVHIQWILRHIPPVITEKVSEELGQFIAPTKCSLVEVPMDSSFDTFWNIYKMPYNKKRAEQAFKNLTQRERVLCINSVKSYDKYLQRVGWQNKQHPSTYITTKNFLTDLNKIS